MPYSLTFISYGIGALGFFGLGLAAITGWHRRDSGRALIVASFITTAWSLSIAAQAQWGFPSFTIRLSLEHFRNLAWIFLLLRVLGLTKETFLSPKENTLFWLAITALALTLFPLSLRFAYNLFEISNTYFLISSRSQLLFQISCMQSVS